MRIDNISNLISMACGQRAEVSFRQVFVFARGFHFTYFWLEEPVARMTEGFRTEKISNIFPESA